MAHQPHGNFLDSLASCHTPPVIHFHTDEQALRPQERRLSMSIYPFRRAVAPRSGRCENLTCRNCSGYHGIGSSPRSGNMIPLARTRFWGSQARSALESALKKPPCSRSVPFPKQAIMADQASPATIRTTKRSPRQRSPAWESVQLDRCIAQDLTCAIAAVNRAHPSRWVCRIGDDAQPNSCARPTRTAKPDTPKHGFLK